MTIQINKEVDIYKLPDSNTQMILTSTLDKPLEVTLGDLHGNAMKLLYMLVEHGVISELSEDTYRELVRIYLAHLDEDQRTKLMSFSGVKQFPMRVKCATLSWHTLVSAMKGKKEEINTEVID